MTRTPSTSAKLVLFPMALIATMQKTCQLASPRSQRCGTGFVGSLAQHAQQTMFCATSHPTRTIGPKLQANVDVKRKVYTPSSRPLHPVPTSIVRRTAAAVYIDICLNFRTVYRVDGWLGSYHPAITPTSGREVSDPFHYGNFSSKQGVVIVKHAS